MNVECPLCEEKIAELEPFKSITCSCGYEETVILHNVDHRVMLVSEVIEGKIGWSVLEDAEFTKEGQPVGSASVGIFDTLEEAMAYYRKDIGEVE